jgi:hypothetical protein
MVEFDSKNEDYKRLEREIADLRRENAYLRNCLREQEWELLTPRRQRNHTRWAGNLAQAE